MIALIVAVFHVMGLLSSIHAIMRSRTEQGAIAWAVSLNTFPYVAVPACWVLGRSRFQGYVGARHREMAEIAALETKATEDTLRFVLATEQISPAAQAAVRLAKLPFLRGNSVELLVDGDATFSSILEGIERARESILFQFFIVNDDEIGREVKARLIERARAGVRVYFLYDEVGSTGVDFYRYQDGFLHQKVMLIDDSVATVGTANFDNRSFRLNFEISAVVVDGDFASAVESMLETDFSKSRLMTSGEYDAKPWWFRFAVKLARLTAPVQ